MNKQPKPERNEAVFSRHHFFKKIHAKKRVSRIAGTFHAIDTSSGKKPSDTHKKPLSTNTAVYPAALRDTIYLISCSLNQTVPDKDRISSMDFDTIYKFSKFHQLASMVGYALELAEINHPKFKEARAKAIRKEMIMDAEQELICAKMDEAGIWYLPLKGAVLKKYYPAMGIREMTDRDILFDASRAADLREIMEGFGYSTEKYNENHHDIYHKEPVLNFEMHTSLFKPILESDMHAYYHNIEKKLLGSSYKKHMTPEDIYLYLLAHEYKHCSLSGIGLRSLLDLFVFLKAEKLDMSYVSSELDSLGLIDFEKSSRHLAISLYEGRELSPTQQEMLHYFAASGSHGTREHRIQNMLMRHNQNLVKYVLDRLRFPISSHHPSYQAYSRVYPLFYKYKPLLPLLPFYRLYRAISSGRLSQELDVLTESSDVLQFDASCTSNRHHKKHL